MKKKTIQLEYALNSASKAVLWNNISTSIGLQTWLADKVTSKDGIYTFEWSKEEIRQAKAVTVRPNELIRFHWLDDEDPLSYFELKMETNELTGDLSFVITDIVDEEEADELTDLWHLEVGRLQRQCGI